MKITDKYLNLDAKIGLNFMSHLLYIKTQFGLSVTIKFLQLYI